MQLRCPATSPLSCLRHAKPSGRPGCGCPSRWRRGCRTSHPPGVSQGWRTDYPHPTCTRHPCLPPSHAARHPLRGHARIKVVVVVLLFNRQCLGAKHRHHPLQRQNLAPGEGLMGRPGPGPGGRLPIAQAGLFRCSREPKVSLPRRSRARPTPRCQTASGATLHFVPRPWSLGDLQGAPRIRVINNTTGITRSTPPPARLPATKAYPASHALASVRNHTTSPART